MPNQETLYHVADRVATITLNRIEFFRVNAQAVAAIDDLDSESFVQLPEIDVIQTQAATIEEFWHRGITI